jgi:hypothetical protein
MLILSVKLSSELGVGLLVFWELKLHHFSLFVEIINTQSRECF